MVHASIVEYLRMAQEQLKAIPVGHKWPRINHVAAKQEDYLPTPFDLIQ